MLSASTIIDLGHAWNSSIDTFKQEKLEAVSVLRAGAGEHPFQRGGTQQAHQGQLCSAGCASWPPHSQSLMAWNL